MAWLRDLASILRLHIIGIAVAACLTFGWLFSARYLVTVAILGGLDWLLINLLNRVSDIEEDRLNEIRGAQRVAGAPRAYLVGWCLLQAASLALGALLHPELMVHRLAVQLVGVGYSYRIVPTPVGWRRFKDLYFLKNFMSSMLFVETVFIYPLVAVGSAPQIGWPAATTLVLFFVTFEITYEILYDMRDLEGDRAAGVPTYPVVHGPQRARQIIDALLIAAAACIVVGVGAGWLGAREALFAAAPVVQFAFYRPRYARGLSSADCINATHIGTALLLVYLIGTHLWLRAGLPANLYLV